MRDNSQNSCNRHEIPCIGIPIAQSVYQHFQRGDFKVTEKARINSIGLSILGFFAGLLAVMSFMAFYITGEEAGNYYYLGTFFTSLNVGILCLCFGQVYDLLRMILNELEK